MKYTGTGDLPVVTDEQLQSALPKAQPYTICILRAGPLFQAPGPEREKWVADIIWEHGKRNYALLLSGLKRVVCPVNDGSGVSGVSIFDADSDAVMRIMQDDPAVKAGIFRFEIHRTLTFPESCLSGDRHR
jgi:hypothetical protein